MVFLFLLCVVNTLWWCISAFMASNKMNTWMYHYKLTQRSKALKRYAGYLKAFNRARKWMVFWAILSLITGLAWWHFS